MPSIRNQFAQLHSRSWSVNGRELRGRTHPGTGLAPKRWARSSMTTGQTKIYNNTGDAPSLRRRAKLGECCWSRPLYCTAMAHCEPNSWSEPRGLAEVNAIAVDEVIPSTRKPKLHLHTCTDALAAHSMPSIPLCLSAFSFDQTLPSLYFHLLLGQSLATSLRTRR